MEENLKEGEKGAWLSIVAYILLASCKVAIGWWTGSEALSADGINNTTDIVVSVAVLIGLRISRKPRDTNHPYGHRRAETIASLIASFIMIVAGLQVIYQAGRTFIIPDQEAPNMLAAWVALACSAVMWGVYRYNRKLAQKVGSGSLMAAAKDNRSDALVSTGAAIGIIASHFGYPQLDPLAALVVGILICKTAWDIFKESSELLTDGFDEERLTQFRQTIKETPGVKRLKDIRARVHGNHVLLDVIIEVNPDLNVEQGHHICEQIECRLMDEHDVRDVSVHVEPYFVEKQRPLQT